MLSRIFPCAIFLLNIVNVYCKGTSSLTFVIDNTLSMGDEIDQVKRSASDIMDVVFKAKSSRIQDIVLVTINDPGAHLKIKTNNSEEFRRVLNTITVENEDPRNDWPEMSMKGTLIGLESSQDDSFIYVFTDAWPKDDNQMNIVKEMCQRKQSQVLFVITAPYHYLRKQVYPKYEVYYQIAAACSGSVYVCEDKNIRESLEILKNDIQHNSTGLATKQIPPNKKSYVEFTVDDYIDTVQISASGQNVAIHVNAPEQTQEKLLWRTHSKVLKLKSPSPGNYIVTVKANSHTMMSISGTTTIFFKHGFSELEPKYLANTAPQPFANTKSFLSIAVTDLEDALVIKSALILTPDERVIQTLPLRQISKDFYVTIPFVAPSHQFKVGLIGLTKNTGSSIRRIAKIPITPAIPIKLPDAKKPEVEIMEGKAIEVDYKHSVKLTCTVYAFPEPEIKWIDNSGRTIPSKSSLVQEPYKYVSYMEVSKADKKQTYTCYAVNKEGTKFSSVKMNIKDPFTVKSVISGTTTVQYGSQGVFTCDVTAAYPTTIRWYYNDESLIGRVNKIQITDSGKKLTINNMDMSSAQKYTCKVFLNENPDIYKSFSTRVTIVGIEPPHLSGDSVKKALVGSEAELHCRVEKGVPQPELTWMFKGTIEGDGEVLRIPKVDLVHEGRYTCVGKNALGQEKHETNLIVQVSPTIVNTGSKEILATEGEASVRISCSANGRPTPAITWELANMKLENSEKYSIEQGGLTIKHPQVISSGDYECVATNDVTSVRTKFTLRVRQKPQLNGNTAIVAKEGSKVDIECIVLKGSPMPNISWFYMDRLLTTTEPILRIDSVRIEQAGAYRCVAENEVGRDESTTFFTVKSAPRILTIGTKEFLVTEGDESVHIPCSASGSPAPVITWELAKNRLENNDKYSIEQGGLTIKYPQVSSSGDYECVATNDVTSVRTKFTLRVRQKPELAGEEAITAKVGTLVDINCNVLKGWPKPKISWFFMDSLLTTTEPILRIHSVRINQAGRYRCVAENVVGRDEHRTSLTVTYPPKIITNITVYNVVKGDVALRMPCEVIGHPKPKVQWTWNENRTTTWDGSNDVPDREYFVTVDGTLIIRNLFQEHNGEYKCHASNDVGSDTKKFDVYLGEPSDDIEHLYTHYIYIEEGKDKNISCSAKQFDTATKFTRWFMGELELSNNTYLEFENATFSESGNYTCRVGDINGAITEYYYVIVGQPPKFKAFKKELVEWYGDDKMLLDCEVSGNLESQVQWTYNNEVLPNVKSLTLDAALKWGHYTCNVSNPLGYVNRKFEVISKVCVMAKSQDNPQNMPLILSSKSTWPTLRSWMDYATLSSGSEVILSCPNSLILNEFLQFPSQNSIKASCVKQDVYKVNDKEYKLSDLKCSKNVDSVIKKTNIKCLTEHSETISVGFKVNGFLENYEVCFDHDNNIPLYSRALVTRLGTNSTLDYHKVTDFKESDNYKCEAAPCYAKTELTSNEYFEYTAQKTSAFMDPLNVVLSLQETGSKKSSWITIERHIKTKLFAKDFPAVIWSGVDTLQKINGSVIPRYLWKVLRLRYKKQEPVAIVHINALLPTPEDIKCGGSKSSLCTKLIDAYTYCCELNQFLKAFGLEHTSVGEPLKDVEKKRALNV